MGLIPIFPHIDPRPNKHPLYVDLDGTLIRNDSLQQGWLMLLRRSPIAAIRSAWAFRTNRPRAKAIVAHGVDLDPAHLPYRPEVLDYVQNARAEGRRVVLATGSTRKFADAVAKHLGLFDAVFATEREGVNLISKHKLEKIIADAGGQPFEYLGDSHADLVVFEGSAVAGWVGGRKLNVIKTDDRHVHRLAPARNDSPYDLVRLLRPHQWAKNLLVWLPLLAAHQSSGGTIGSTLLATIALCMVASAGYILNDLLDIDADQKHPHKRRRPIASGAVTMSRVIPMLAGLLIVGLIIAGLLGWKAFVAVALYAMLAGAYSLLLKRRLLLDVFALAGLYTMRPVIGGAATGIFLSPMLTAFCVFFFGSLAFLKRFIELRSSFAAGTNEQLPGRGYHPEDVAAIGVAGPVTGIAAVLVIAMYLSSPIVPLIYTRPLWLWAWCPLIAYWILRVWILAGRGTLHHDPVVFALRDSRTYIVVALTLLAAILAGPINPTRLP